MSEENTTPEVVTEATVTAPASSSDPMADAEVAESGSFIKFDEIGAGFTGLVIEYAVKQTGKGPANEYKVITKDGVRTFYAPKDVHDKLSGFIIRYGLGKLVSRVTFKEATKTKSGNDFKIFEVTAKEATPELLAQLGINADANNF